MFNKRALSRNVLAQFLPNPEAIRAFENMTDLVNELSPDTIQTLLINAGNADNNAILALGLIASNYEELSTELAAIDSKNSGLIHNALQVAQDAYEYVSTLPNYQLLSDQIASAVGKITEITFADSPFNITSDNETVIVDAAGGNVVVNLLASSLGRYVCVQKTDVSANTVTVNGNPTINGVAANVLNAQYDSRQYLSNSAEYVIL